MTFKEKVEQKIKPGDKIIARGIWQRHLTEEQAYEQIEVCLDKLNRGEFDQ